MATHVLINDFSHADPKTLAGRKGEEFTVTQETGGWSQCINSSGRQGLIPSSYLKALPTASSSSSDGEYVEGLFDYPGNPADNRILAFKAKDVMKVTKKAEGWWTCEIVGTGKIGLCPQTYLKACAPPAAAPAPAPAPAPASAPAPSPAASDDDSSKAGTNPLALAAANVRLKKTGPLIAPSSAAAPVTAAAAVVLKPAFNKTEEPKAPLASAQTSSVIQNTNLKPASPSSVTPSPSYQSSNSSSGSSAAVVQKSLQSDNLSELLAQFNSLQQEANSLLKQQTSELAETKELVRRILQIKENV